MFTSLPAYLRSQGLTADVRTLLLFRRSIETGLVKTLGDVYNVLRGIVVKDPQELGPYTKAYYKYFLNIEINNGESLNDAILRSDTFQQWKNQYLEEADIDKDVDLEDLVNQFLNDVHLTQYDINEIIDGSKLFHEDDPDLTDEESGQSSESTLQQLQKMADYSDLSLEELLERLEKIKEQQKSNHSGGSHWIGTGGISPFGHGGAAKDGIRIGGTGGGKMARKVMADQNYFPIERDAILNDNNVDAALASVKGVIEESAIEKLDIPTTIKSGIKRGGLFIPEMHHEKTEKMQIIILIDNGGWSMSPYIKTVRDLFKKMKTRFAHDMEVYYFHNTIYDVIYTDEQRYKPIPIKKLLDKDKNYRVFIIGDAAMAPYELGGGSIRVWQAIQEKFKKTVWLNPEPVKFWSHTYTIQVLQQIIEMFPLTPNGIERAVRHMNRKSNQ